MALNSIWWLNDQELEKGSNFLLDFPKDSQIKFTTNPYCKAHGT